MYDLKVLNLTGMVHESKFSYYPYIVRHHVGEGEPIPSHDDFVILILASENCRNTYEFSDVVRS